MARGNAVSIRGRGNSKDISKRGGAAPRGGAQRGRGRGKPFGGAPTVYREDEGPNEARVSNVPPKIMPASKATKVWQAQAVRGKGQHNLSAPTGGARGSTMSGGDNQASHDTSTTHSSNYHGGVVAHDHAQPSVHPPVPNGQQVNIRKRKATAGTPEVDDTQQGFKIMRGIATAEDEYAFRHHTIMQVAGPSKASRSIAKIAMRPDQDLDDGVGISIAGTARPPEADAIEAVARHSASPDRPVISIVGAQKAQVGLNVMQGPADPESTLVPPHNHTHLQLDRNSSHRDHAEAPLQALSSSGNDRANASLMTSRTDDEAQRRSRSPRGRPRRSYEPSASPSPERDRDHSQRRPRRSHEPSIQDAAARTPDRNTSRERAYDNDRRAASHRNDADHRRADGSDGGTRSADYRSRYDSERREGWYGRDHVDGRRHDEEAEFYSRRGAYGHGGYDRHEWEGSYRPDYYDDRRYREERYSYGQVSSKHHEKDYPEYWSSRGESRPGSMATRDAGSIPKRDESSASHARRSWDSRAAESSSRVERSDRHPRHSPSSAHADPQERSRSTVQSSGPHSPPRSKPSAGDLSHSISSRRSPPPHDPAPASEAVSLLDRIGGRASHNDMTTESRVRQARDRHEATEPEAEHHSKESTPAIQTARGNPELAQLAKRLGIALPAKESGGSNHIKDENSDDDHQFFQSELARREMRLQSRRSRLSGTPAIGEDARRSPVRAELPLDTVTLPERPLDHGQGRESTEVHPPAAAEASTSSVPSIPTAPRLATSPAPRENDPSGLHDQDSSQVIVPNGLTCSIAGTAHQTETSDLTPSVPAVVQPTTPRKKSAASDGQRKRALPPSRNLSLPKKPDFAPTVVAERQPPQPSLQQVPSGPRRPQPPSEGPPPGAPTGPRASRGQETGRSSPSVTKIHSAGSAQSPGPPPPPPPGRRSAPHRTVSSVEPPQAPVPQAQARIIVPVPEPAPPLSEVEVDAPQSVVVEDTTKHTAASSASAATAATPEPSKGLAPAPAPGSASPGLYWDEEVIGLRLKLMAKRAAIEAPKTAHANVDEDDMDLDEGISNCVQLSHSPGPVIGAINPAFLNTSGSGLYQAASVGSNQQQQSHAAGQAGTRANAVPLNVVSKWASASATSSTVPIPAVAEATPTSQPVTLSPPISQPASLEDSSQMSDVERQQRQALAQRKMQPLASVGKKTVKQRQQDLAAANQVENTSRKSVLLAELNLRKALVADGVSPAEIGRLQAEVARRRTQAAMDKNRARQLAENLAKQLTSNAKHLLLAGGKAEKRQAAAALRSENATQAVPDDADSQREAHDGQSKSSHAPVVAALPQHASSTIHPMHSFSAIPAPTSGPSSASPQLDDADQSNTLTNADAIARAEAALKEYIAKDKAARVAAELGLNEAQRDALASVALAVPDVDLMTFGRQMRPALDPLTTAPLSASNPPAALSASNPPAASLTPAAQMPVATAATDTSEQPTSLPSSTQEPSKMEDVKNEHDRSQVKQEPAVPTQIKEEAEPLLSTQGKDEANLSIQRSIPNGSAEQSNASGQSTDRNTINNREQRSSTGPDFLGEVRAGFKHASFSRSDSVRFLVPIASRQFQGERPTDFDALVAISKRGKATAALRSDHVFTEADGAPGFFAVSDDPSLPKILTPAVEDSVRVSTKAIAIVASCASVSNPPATEQPPHLTLGFVHLGDSNTPPALRWNSFQERPHTHGATCVSTFPRSNPGGLDLATGGSDGIVYSWRWNASGDAGSPRSSVARVHDAHASTKKNGGVLALTQIHTHATLVSAGGDGFMVVYDVSKGQQTDKWKTSDRVRHLQRGPAAHLFLASLLRPDYDQFKAFDVRATRQGPLSRPVLTFGWQASIVPSMTGRGSWHPSRKWLFMQPGEDGYVRLWDTRMPRADPMASLVYSGSVLDSVWTSPSEITSLVQNSTYINRVEFK